MMRTQLPQREHIYQSFLLNSAYWDHYTARDDDIVVATTQKSGTTWMQMIVLHLIFQDMEDRPVWKFSRWLDNAEHAIKDRIVMFEAQEHRRCIKTHLPLDGLKYFPQVKYIMVGRDARDVFMSLWNHYSNFTDEFFVGVNDNPARIGKPLPRCPEDIHEFWRDWMTKGWFEWETEGYPFWSTLHYAQTWWDYRHLPNILLVHFNDLLLNLEAEIARIAAFLEISASPELITDIAQATTFANVKEKAEVFLPNAEQDWKGGAQTFFNKGTNGRWREVLSGQDLELYHAAVQRELSPDCARWLENGWNSI